MNDLDEIWGTPSILFGAGPNSTIHAEATAGDLAEVLFFVM